MSQQFLTDVALSGSRAPAQVLIPQLSLQSMFWRPKFLESSEWLPLVPVAFWLVEAQLPHRIVELGTRDGASYFAFCQAMDRLRPFGECLGFCAKNPEVKLQQYNEAQYQEFSQLSRATQAQALAQIEKGSIDLLHITASAAPHIAKQWHHWLERLSSRGLVLISGVNSSGEHEKSASLALFEQLKAQYSHFLFRQASGLGVVGIGEQQNETLKRLFGFAPGDQSVQLVQQVFTRLGLACAASQKVKELKQQHQHTEAQLSYKTKKVEGLRATVNDLKARQRAQEVASEAAAEEAQQAQQRLLNDQETRLEEIIKLTKLLQAAEACSETAQRELVSKQSCIDGLEQRLSEQESKKQRLEKANDGQQQHIAELESTLRKREEDAARVAEAQQGEGRRLKELESAYAKLKQANEQLTQQFAEQQQQRQKASDLALERARQLERLEAEKSQVEQQVAQLQPQLESASQQIEILKQQNRHLLAEQQVRFQELAELTRLLEETERQHTNSSEEATTNHKSQRPGERLSLPAMGKRWRLNGKAARELKKDLRLIQASGLFDEAWYLQQNPDVLDSGIPAGEHFLRFGGSEGRSPSPAFDSQWYLRNYPDVVESGINPLMHYLKFGKSEARWPTSHGEQGEGHGH